MYSYDYNISECHDYGGVLISEGVVLCTDFNGVELGPEDVSFRSIGCTMYNITTCIYSICSMYNNNMYMYNNNMYIA